MKAGLGKIDLVCKPNANLHDPAGLYGAMDHDCKSHPERQRWISITFPPSSGTPTACEAGQ
jgi:hypothetical protein